MVAAQYAGRCRHRALQIFITKAGRCQSAVLRLILCYAVLSPQAHRLRRLLAGAQIHPPQTCKRSVEDDACIVPHTELQPWDTVINILSPRRAFLFSTRSPSVCGKPFRFFSLFPVVTRSAFLFLPTNCPCSRKVYRNFQLFHALFIRSSFLFFMIEFIGGPHYRPQLEDLLCTKPNSRATPKRRPALYMP